MGRPRQAAPEGYMTPREVGDALGVTEGAIRGRIHRGTIPIMPPEDAGETPAGEQRYYIPNSWVEHELAMRNLPASRADTDEVALLSERLGAELKGVIEQGFEVIGRKIDRQREEVLAELTEQREAVLAELQKQGVNRSGQFAEIKNIAEQMLRMQQEFLEGRGRGTEALEALQKEFGKIRAEQAEDRKDLKAARDREQHYQEQNLNMQNQNLELQRRISEILHAVQQAEAERREQGTQERRSFWRRLFAG